jgi:serine/threonine protein kinase
MGEVFRARDTRLDRTVAVKVLSAELAADEEGRKRFEREARAIAALSHPHICTLHDVGRDNGVDYLVMELVEGRTLAERLQSGRLEVPEALAYATDIADALAAAHRHGIVHRDLKPGNIMLARPGAGSGSPPRAKLLDFGLARLRVEPVLVGDAATATAELTAAGKILGTLNYMAPEQLEGRPHDARADVFAFGAILFEMITGRRAFDGPNPASVVGAVLHTTPPSIAAAVPGAPPALERLIAVCLARNADDRWSSAHDVLLQLRAVSLDARPTSDAAAPRGTGREWLAWAVAALLGATTILAIAWPRPGRTTPSAAEPELLSVLPPPVAATSHSWEAPQISPDGRLIAFVASDASGSVKLYVRSRADLSARTLTGTEDATLPFWSPDSSMLGFFAGAQLKTVALAGGAPRTIAPAPVPRGGAWGADGRILFSALPNNPPMIVPAAGGEAQPVPVSGPERGFRSFPQLLRDGRHYLYQALDPIQGGPMGLRVASLDTTDVKDIVKTRANGLYVGGWILYLREAALVAQRFDVATLQVEGTPIVMAEDVGFNGITYQGLYSVSEDAIAYLGPMRGAQLAWFDRQGRSLGAATAPGDFSTLCLTSDAKHAVFEQTDPLTGGVDLWLLDLGTRQTSRLTFDAAVDFFPVCGPPGPSSGDVIFSSLRSGPPSLFRLPIGAPGSEKPALLSYVAKLPSDWTRDGRSIVFSILNPKTSWDIAVWPVAGGEPRPIVATAADELNGHVSPDGRWLAYTADEGGGLYEIYVQPFPAGGAKWQVSRGGGNQPGWRGDGGELYYVSRDRKLMAVPVKAGPSDLAFGEARALMEARVTGRDGSSNTSVQYAATADGERFLVSTAASEAMPITLMLNWTAKVRR